jgi:NAD(P)-dependent dehydrogenase (short-subunit alcohol dehydrogenase family)
MRGDSPLEGKVAWITGGSSGVGLAAALELARAGARVAISGRNAQTLKAAEAELKAAGKGESVHLDVSDRRAVERVAADIEARHGRIDILVNSAGINVPRRHFRTLELGAWDEVIAINLSGLFYCCYAAMAGMRARKDGLIINISSWVGRYASHLTGPAYNAAKRAVIAVTESINIEECGNGIRATTILPGEVATPIMRKRPVPPPEQELARMLQAEDVGRTILFIATLPARACVNELILSPTWNRFYIGGLETPRE